MSRTKHITAAGPRPHRQRAKTRLTKHRSEWSLPEVPRPKNVGGSPNPCGGYANDRAVHALYKKLDKRRQRRRRNRGELD